MPTYPASIDSRLLWVFTVMSRLAAQHGAINLSQGFPDFSAPPALFDLVAKHMHAGAAHCSRHVVDYLAQTTE